MQAHEHPTRRRYQVVVLDDVSRNPEDLHKLDLYKIEPMPMRSCM